MLNKTQEKLHDRPQKQAPDSCEYRHSYRNENPIPYSSNHGWSAKTSLPSHSRTTFILGASLQCGQMTG
jgi:hypothetical protein